MTAGRSEEYTMSAGDELRRDLAHTIAGPLFNGVHSNPTKILQEVADAILAAFRVSRREAGEPEQICQVCAQELEPYEQFVHAEHVAVVDETENPIPRSAS